MKTPTRIVNRVKCATCPFRDGSPYADLQDWLTRSALSTASRICHSTGTSAINGRTGKPERLCRGARDIQLRLMHSMRVLEHPTDECWEQKWKEIQSDRRRKKI